MAFQSDFDRMKAVVDGVDAPPEKAGFTAGFGHHHDMTIFICL